MPTLIRSHAINTLLITILSIAPLCSLASEATISSESPFRALKDTINAPDAIKKASQAIFQLSGGTAAFVSVNGKSLIMTNYHILGPSNCARSGCYAEAFFGVERQGKLEKKTLFLVPFATNQDVDVSFFEFQEITSEGKLREIKPSSFLSFAPLLKPNELLKKLVYVVGHPRLGLKKYSEGNIIKLEKGHILVSAFTLPGNSGSPILSAEGKIVGIHHSSVKRNDNVTRDSFLHEGKGSNSIAILAVLTKSMLNPNETKSQFFALDQAFSYDQAKRLTPIFQNARVVPILKDGKSFFNELLQECKITINTFAGSSSTFSTSHEACSIGRYWMGCQTPDPMSGPVFSLSTAKTAEHPDFILNGNWCPSAEVRREWVKVFQKIGDKYEDFAGQSPLRWSADAVFQSFTNKETGARVAFKTTKTMIEKNEDPLSFEAALDLIKYADYEPNPTAKGISLVQMVKQYRRFYQYQYELLEIGNVTVKLLKQSRISKEEGQRMMDSLLEDKNITLHAWLNLERLALESGLLR